MALRSHPSAGERMADTLPQSLQANPGLLFDRARGLRLSGGSGDEPELLVKAPTRAMAKIDPSHWWGELSIAARQAMKDGNYNIAYDLVSGTGLNQGGDFAEAEFMAGWIALRFLHKPEQALTHFRQLAGGVSRPISVARADYWIGRTYEAEDKMADATRAYAVAADNPETFYGQLALARIEDAPRLHLKETAAHVSAARASFEKDSLTRAIRVLADLGEERFVRLFAVQDAELHPDAGHIELLASDLVRMGYREIAVRVAKTASYDGIDLFSYSHPVIALPGYRGPGDTPEARTGACADPAGDRIQSRCRQPRGRARHHAADAADGQADGAAVAPALSAFQTDDRHPLQHPARHDRARDRHFRLGRLLHPGGGGLQCRARQS